jgi:hypothetical protein
VTGTPPDDLPQPATPIAKTLTKKQQAKLAIGLIIR